MLHCAQVPSPFPTASPISGAATFREIGGKIVATGTNSPIVAQTVQSAMTSEFNQSQDPVM
jgi:hypothetical protein